MSERKNVSLFGEDREMLEELIAQNGGCSAAKVVSTCMKQTLDRRSMIMRSWSQLMIGVTQSMGEQGLEEEFVRVVEWFNVCGQQILTNRMSAQEFLQVTEKVDAWMAEMRQARETEAEEELRDLIKQM